MKKLFVLLLLAFSTVSYSQIMKTGGLLYSNGNPNTKGLDTLTLKNLNRNSEVAVDVSSGSLFVFDRSDSTYKTLAKLDLDTILGTSKVKAPNAYSVKKYVDENSGGGGTTVLVDARPYKVYSALLTQSGTDAPVAIVLENTLGDTVVWSRNDVGYYVATISGNKFTQNKTFVKSREVSDQDNEVNASTNLTYLIADQSSIVFTPLLIPSANYIDGLWNAPIEIRVY